MKERLAVVDVKLNQIDDWRREFRRTNSEQVNIIDLVNNNHKSVQNEVKFLRDMFAKGTDMINNVEMKIPTANTPNAIRTNTNDNDASVAAKVKSLIQDVIPKGSVNTPILIQDPKIQESSTYSEKVKSMPTTRIDKSNYRNKDINMDNVKMADNVAISNRVTSDERHDNTVSDELTGFTVVERRAKLTALFISYIVVNDNNVDATIGRVVTYMETRGCTVRSVRKIKQSGVTLSVKAVVKQSDEENMMADGFWPEGIRCRQWNNY